MEADATRASTVCLRLLAASTVTLDRSVIRRARVIICTRFVLRTLVESRRKAEKKQGEAKRRGRMARRRVIKALYKGTQTETGRREHAEGTRDGTWKRERAASVKVNRRHSEGQGNSRGIADGKLAKPDIKIARNRANVDHWKNYSCDIRESEA